MKFSVKIIFSSILLTSLTVFSTTNDDLIGAAKKKVFSESFQTKVVDIFNQKDSCYQTQSCYKKIFLSTLKNLFSTQIQEESLSYENKNNALTLESLRFRLSKLTTQHDTIKLLKTFAEDLLILEKNDTDYKTINELESACVENYFEKNDTNSEKVSKISTSRDFLNFLHSLCQATILINQFIAEGFIDEAIVSDLISEVQNAMFTSISETTIKESLEKTTAPGCVDSISTSSNQIYSYFKDLLPSNPSNLYKDLKDNLQQGVQSLFGSCLAPVDEEKE